MTTYVPVGLRRLVARRANSLCEYCLIHERDTYLGCQVDHIVAEKHGGPTNAANLCFACTFCNRAKGSDLGSLASDGELVRFYNPRTDHWADHFTLDGSTIQSRTDIGDVTVRILGFNAPERAMERTLLGNVGRFPPDEALDLLVKS
jgi:hypothetical protein